MKFKADRATLMKALAHIQSVAEKRNTIPILANVKIEATDGKLHVHRDRHGDRRRRGDRRQRLPPRLDHRARPRRCTRSSASCPTAPSSSSKPPARRGQLKLRAGRYATSLVTLPVDDFPSMTAGQLPYRFRISSLALRGLIDRTRFAISTEETRYYLNGIYLHCRRGRHRPRAPRRRHRRPPPRPRRGAGARGRDGMPGVIIPRKTVAELRKLLDEESGEVEVGLSDTRIQFRSAP